MRTESATDVKNKFGEMLDAARREPLVIQRSGRNVAVMMSYEEYEHFQAFEDAYWTEKALEGEKSGFLSAEESEALLREMLNADN